MKNLWFSPKSPSTSHHSLISTPQHTFSSSMMEEDMELAESVITKWDIDSSSYTKISSLFTGERTDSKEFLKSVRELQSAMEYFISENSGSEKLIRGQNVMKIAMRILEKEFFQILSANTNFLDSESISNRSTRESTRTSVSDFEYDVALEDEIQLAGSSVIEVERESENVMADLKLIADCMISSGYGKECVKIYKLIRKSIIDESLYHLGVENLSFAKIQKMDWEVLELKIKQWLNAVKIAMKTLFYGERILCDHVFSGSDRIIESCFAEISTSGALMLLVFPGNVAKCKKSPEKMFRLLDLCDTVSDLWQDMESIFSFESSSAVRSQAVTSLLKLGDAIRTILSDFEAAIQKDSSKSVVLGGGVHPLTRYVMNYFVFLADYSGILSDILADYPLTAQSPLPESYFSIPSPGDDPSSAISLRFAWIILVLLCKLDGKAQLYKDVTLSYLFLANNLNYVVSKVKNSNLQILLGNDWLIMHESKVNQYAANYVRIGWSKVISSLPEDPTADISPDVAKACFERFNSDFEEAYRKKSSWFIPDPKLRDQIKVSVAKRLVPVYQEFYERNRRLFRREAGVEAIIRFAPEDLGNYLSDLFIGTGVLGGSTSSYSSVASFPSRDG